MGLTLEAARRWLEMELIGFDALSKGKRKKIADSHKASHDNTAKKLPNGDEKVKHMVSSHAWTTVIEELC